MTTETQTLKLDQLRIDGGTQPRVAIDEQVVAEYAEKYGEGVDLLPVTVFFDGTAYWLADGFHRYWARKRIESDTISAEVHQGTHRDAILFSVGANSDHGLRRTFGDKRKAVLTMLEDEEWSQWSNCEIARQCKVVESYVRKMKDGHTSHSAKYESDERTFIHHKTGKPARMRTAKIGGKRSKRKKARAASEMNPVRQPRPALAQTNLNLPHDPAYGARAIVSAMGVDYARQLIESLTSYLQDKKEGDA